MEIQDILILILAGSGSLNIILFLAWQNQKSNRKMMDKRYENAMEEIQRIRANYNDLLHNQSDQ